VRCMCKKKCSSHQSCSHCSPPPTRTTGLTASDKAGAPRREPFHSVCVSSDHEKPAGSGRIRRTRPYLYPSM
jgi:hypothetical protein